MCKRHKIRTKFELKVVKLFGLWNVTEWEPLQNIQEVPNLRVLLTSLSLCNEHRSGFFDLALIRATQADEVVMVPLAGAHK